MKLHTNIFSKSYETSVMKTRAGDIFQKWISLVWCKHVSKLNEPTVLIVDNYSPHSSKDVTKILNTKNSFLSIIPSGCSSNIQPLNRGIKRSFKVSIIKVEIYRQTLIISIFTLLNFSIFRDIFDT